MLAHILADVHETLRRLAAFESTLAEFRPLIDAWRRTNGGTMGLFKARRELRNAQPDDR